MRLQIGSVVSAQTVLAGLVAAVAGALVLAHDPSSAWAQQPAQQSPIQVTANKAAILRLAGQAQNVIIGDPRVADVTVETRSMLILFGRAPGETNLIVLDAQNREIVSAPVVVTAEKDRHVSVIAAAKSGPTEVVYSCAERCIKVDQKGAAAAASGGGGPPVAGPAEPSEPAPAAAPPQTPAQAPAQAPGGKGYKR